jgi:hypothetical protein
MKPINILESFLITPQQWHMSIKWEAWRLQFAMNFQNAYGFGVKLETFGLVLNIFQAQKA